MNKDEDDEEIMVPPSDPDETDGTKSNRKIIISNRVKTGQHVQKFKSNKIRYFQNNMNFYCINSSFDMRIVIILTFDMMHYDIDVY